MSIFSRALGFIRSVVRPANFDDELREQVDAELVDNDIANDDDLQVIWETSIEDNLGDIADIKEFALDNHGAELFNRGWIDDDESEEDRALAREEFFELMEAYDISRDEFDWDAWRDWYEDA